MSVPHLLYQESRYELQFLPLQPGPCSPERDIWHQLKVPAKFAMMEWIGEISTNLGTGVLSQTPQMVPD